MVHVPVDVKAVRLLNPPAAGAELVQVVPFDVSTLPDVPGDTLVTAPVPFPRTTALAVNVVTPVPPCDTLKAPPEPTNIVPLVAGIVIVVVPATAGGEIVTEPELEPLSVKLPIRLPSIR